MLVEVERSDPVLANAAVLTHVEANLPFDFGVDQPITSLDAQAACVQVCERPGHFDVVVTYTHHVDKCPEHAVGFVLLRIDDKAVGKGWFLMFIFYKLVLVVDKVYDFVTVKGIKLRFFVHVQYPGFWVDFLVHSSIMQRTRFK